ncbi:MAG: hypothetical protein QM722_01350 [Piscinibacter sp.]
MAVPKREASMLKLAILGGGALALARYADVLPSGQATTVLGGAVITVMLIWVGLFARV